MQIIIIIFAVVRKIDYSRTTDILLICEIKVQSATLINLRQSTVQYAILKYYRISLSNITFVVWITRDFRDDRIVAIIVVEHLADTFIETRSYTFFFVLVFFLHRPYHADESCLRIGRILSSTFLGLANEQVVSSSAGTSLIARLTVRGCGLEQPLPNISVKHSWSNSSVALPKFYRKHQKF